MLTERQREEALGVGLIALALLLGLAVLSPLFTGSVEAGNLIGPVGELVRYGLWTVFGWSSVLVVIPAAVWGLRFLGVIPSGAAVRTTVLAAGVILVAPTAWWLLSGVTDPSVSPGAGWLGRTVGGLLVGGFGPLGANLIVFASLLTLLVLTLGWGPFRAALRGLRGLLRLTEAGIRRAIPAVRSGSVALVDLFRSEPTAVEAQTPWEAVSAKQEKEAPIVERTPEPTHEEPDEDPVEPESEPELLAHDTGDTTLTELPPIDLLEEPSRTGSGLDQRDLKTLGDILIDKLGTFRVKGTVSGWTTGPAVTQFEVEPAPGVKVGQIAALADDLALALRAPSVRIVAPIPGKGAVGVEVPNPEPEIVHLRPVLEAPSYKRGRKILPLALGRDLAGDPYSADLARMPHLLIAGATGSGKSVCINTIITSLVYKYTPQELRLLMIDPKMVELIMYNDLPHLRHPVVTDNNDAATTLKWAVYEMGRRYALLSANASRNVVEFNRRVKRGDDLQKPKDRGGGEYLDGALPYIVLIIDELADLMMTVQAEIETPLAILAQKARAVGIHLVVATQRPSVNVITGLIKANFSSRIAFRVASKTDSRTILDQNGAESLLGNGDMLFLPPGESDPIRVQGAFIETGETERLIEWFRQQTALSEAREAESAAAIAAGGEEDILEVMREMELEESQAEAVGPLLGDWDTYFWKAGEIVITNGAGSTSLLQRRLKIGYGRAARIIDQLHESGVLGPPDGSRPREVLMTLERLDGLKGGAKPDGDTVSTDGVGGTTELTDG